MASLAVVFSSFINSTRSPNLLPIISIAVPEPGTLDRLCSTNHWINSAAEDAVAVQRKRILEARKTCSVEDFCALI